MKTKLTTVDKLIKYRYPIFLVLFVILVLFKLHGSSIGMWDQYIKGKQDPNQISVLIGKDRAIRSDEWLVQTPWILSQVKNEHFFPLKNENIRSDGQNMLIPNTPVLSLNLLGKPYYWGYVLFGADYGLSWYWVSRVMLFILLSYELAFFLTNGNRRLSLLGSIWIGLSPAIMWWFNTAVVDLILCAQGMIVSALYYVRNPERRRLRLLYMFLFTISVIGFVVVLYPPIQVPLGFLVLIFVTYLFYPHFKKLIQCKQELYFSIFCFLLVAASVGLFVYQSMEDLKIMLQTVYPGKRVALGGNYNLLELQQYVTNWLTPFREINFSNSSEISGFFNFLPAILFTFVIVFRLESQHKKLLYALLGYLIFQLSWLIYTYPLWFAKATLFSYVTEPRLANLILGMTAVYMSLWLAAMLEKHKPFKRMESILLSGLIGLIYLESIYHTQMIGYFHNKLALMTVAVLVLLNYLLLMGRMKSFSVMMAAVVIISGASVNPISTGTGSIYSKHIAQKIMAIDKEDPNQTWAAFNGLTSGQYLVALGVKSFNGVHDYPDLAMWQKLDPSGKYAEVYNRYAHVQLLFTSEPTSFKLVQADIITVYLNLSDLKLTGIKYILSPNELPALAAMGAKDMYVDPVDHLHIYRLE